LCFECLRQGRRTGLVAEWLPWLAFCGYAIMSGVLAAIGRSHISLEQALRPRYCTISLWLVVGIVGLSVTLLRGKTQQKPAWNRVLAVIGTLFFFFYVRHMVYAAHKWSDFAEWMRFQEQSFGLESSQPGQTWTLDHPNRQMVLVTYGLMRKCGFLKDSTRSTEVVKLLAANAPADREDGDWEMTVSPSFREIHCRGWSTNRKADGGNRVLIVLVFPSAKVLALADAPINGRQVAPDQRPESSNYGAGFDLKVKLPRLAPGAYRVAAFRHSIAGPDYHMIDAPKSLPIGR